MTSPPATSGGHIDGNDASATDSDTLKFAVVGMGKMGIMHTAMLQTIPGARVVALVDSDVKACNQVVTMGLDATIYPTLIECLEQEKLDGIVISTPQFTHRELLEKALERGVSVMCEKPLAHTLGEARAMLQLAQQHANEVVAVGYMLAHNPIFSHGAKLVADGVLGEIKNFRASCRLSQVFSPKKGWTFSREKAGGGVVINSGCHLLYVLDLIFGQPSQVVARGQGVHNEVEDTFAAFMDYPSGAWGMLEINWSVPGYESQTHDVEIVGTNGTVSLSNEEARLWLSKKSGGYDSGYTTWKRHEMEPRSPFTLSPDYCGDEFYLENLDFVHAIRDKRSPRVDVTVAYRVQEVLHNLYVSLKMNGEPVEIVSELKGEKA